MIQRSAPAKLNLGLHVLAKRDDGFHEIETVMVRIPWVDTVTAVPADGFTFTCSDPDLPVDEGNLCVRAAQLLAREAGISPRCLLHLEKRVPYGAGLGSGSSDAAATLRLLIELWDLRMAVEDVRAVAARLGSDVPFFLGPRAALASGRGEQLTPLIDPRTREPYRLPYDVVVVVPNDEVPTAAAYMMVKPEAVNRPSLQELVLTDDVARWRDELRNDFEPPILDAYPAVRAALQALKDAGAGYASLSGSGAAVFGLFEETQQATAAAEAARLAGHRVFRF